MPLKPPLSAIATGRQRVPSSQMFAMILAGDQTKSYQITVYLLSASSISEAAWPINKPVSVICFRDQSRDIGTQEEVHNLSRCSEEPND